MVSSEFFLQIPVTPCFAYYSAIMPGSFQEVSIGELFVVVTVLRFSWDSMYRGNSATVLAWNFVDYLVGGGNSKHFSTVAHVLEFLITF